MKTEGRPPAKRFSGKPIAIGLAFLLLATPFLVTYLARVHRLNEAVQRARQEEAARFQSSRPEP